MNNYQPSHSRQSSFETPHLNVRDRKGLEGKAEDTKYIAQSNIQELHERNVLLAKMLDDAVASLRSIKVTPDTASESEQSLNISLAKIQFVSVYLSNPDIPIPKEERLEKSKTVETKLESLAERPDTATPGDPPSQVIHSPIPEIDVQKAHEEEPPGARKESGQINKPPARPSLMDSSFSFMLGDNRHRSSFVSSVADLPEQRRDSESKSRSKPVSAEVRTQQERRESASVDDGFTLTKIQGGGHG